LLWKRADLKIVDLRGNVPTRLRKFADNDWDAIVLAHAGLSRLGLSPADDRILFAEGQFFVEILPRKIFLPAGGQGIIALQVRASDQNMKATAELVNDRQTLLCLRAEREFLRLLQGDCNCPVGVLASIDNNRMNLTAQLFIDQLAAPREAEAAGAHTEDERLAKEVLNRLGAPSFRSTLRPYM
jgi:hydroxymethylbilane synthase